MGKKISEIASIIREETGQAISAEKLNKMLVGQGDLADTALGKVETKQGRDRGISGGLHTNENGEEYWTPKYSETAVDYVIASAKQYFPELQELLPQNEEIGYICGRRSSIYRELKEQYPDYVIILEGDIRFYVYDNSAVMLGSLFNFGVHKNSNGESGVAFKKDVLNIVRSALDEHSIPWILSTPNDRKQIYSGNILSAQQLLLDDGIKDGDWVVLLLETGERITARMTDVNSLGSHIFEGITIFESDIPTDQLNSTIATNGPLYQALLGKHVGDRVSVSTILHGETTITNYMIEKVLEAPAA